MNEAMTKRVLVLASALVLAACSSSASDVVGAGNEGVLSDAGGADASSSSGNGDAGKTIVDGAIPIGDSAVSDAPWAPVSFGITAKDIGSGDNIAIAYGGY